MKRMQDDTNMQAFFGNLNLATMEIGNLLQSYLALPERDTDMGVTQGKPKRAEQAEQDIIEPLRDLREQVELLKRRFAGPTTPDL